MASASVALAASASSLGAWPVVPKGRGRYPRCGRLGGRGGHMRTARSIRLIVVLAAGLAVWLAVPLAAWAASGDLDATFGAGGKVTTDFAGGDDAAFAVVLQPDGRLVAAGQASTGYRQGDFALARYNPNGSLDATFGAGGKVTTDFAGDQDAARG